ncbi:hypothetical protein AVEN_244723-1 [Araneus ventricosus]|uniref:Uncharacterized protein n=1 Tax=Araneus ventricosus TaxID=182803 RepID=A0A4Y2BTV9_ARAVE|nr:hypothetical protein AVEN_244723-1 [Araneus ventricosus]
MPKETGLRALSPFSRVPPNDKGFQNHKRASHRIQLYDAHFEFMRYQSYTCVTAFENGDWTRRVYASGNFFNILFNSPDLPQSKCHLFGRLNCTWAASVSRLMQTLTLRYISGSDSCPKTFMQ